MAKYVRHEHFVRTQPETWTRRGFLPEEVYRLVEISAIGADAPSLRLLRRHRAAINANAKRYHWTEEKLRSHIVKDYQRYDIGKNEIGDAADDVRKSQFVGKHFYDYFKGFKIKAAEADKDYYENGTPRPKKLSKHLHKAAQKKSQAIENKIRALEQKRARAELTNDYKEIARLDREILRYGKEY
jgi:hypothetical protein